MYTLVPLRVGIHSGRLPSARISKLRFIPRLEIEALVREGIRKTHKISVANQKGGVAKTTTNINLAAALVVKGKKVLVVDLDPQGGCSVMLGYDPGAFSTTLYNVLLSDLLRRRTQGLQHVDIKLRTPQFNGKVETPYTNRWRSITTPRSFCYIITL